MLISHVRFFTFFERKIKKVKSINTMHVEFDKLE